jgi:hypothetical protein
MDIREKTGQPTAVIPVWYRTGQSERVSNLLGPMGLEAPGVQQLRGTRAWCYPSSSTWAGHHEPPLMQDKMAPDIHYHDQIFNAK